MKMFTTIIRTHIYPSPVGRLLLGSVNGRICLCDWLDAPHRNAVDRRIQRCLTANFRNGWSDALAEAVRQLDRYFDDTSAELDFPIVMAGSELQVRVWNEIRKIPKGETVTYRDLASKITGSIASTRVIANAVGANALSLIVPCHRVIGTGHTGGYSGGQDVKEYLLMRECSREKLVTLLP